MPFGANIKTGDARISGSLASLVGLEAALEAQDEEAVGTAIKTIVLLHSVILSFGGLPLMYYGDAIGTLNNLEFLTDPVTQNDSRWVHRSRFDWDKAEKRHQTGTVEQRIFSALKKLIALRKEIPAFADFDNRHLLLVDNPNLLVFYRTDPENSHGRVLVISNFNVEAQQIPVDALRPHGFFAHESMTDLCSCERVPMEEDQMTIPALSSFWLKD